MAKTIVQVVIPFTFVNEGEYRVTFDGKEAIIKVEYVPTHSVTDSIKGIVSEGKVTLKPDDPEGQVNISKITIEIPFMMQESFENDDRLERIKIECMAYLNRLRDVVRDCTQRYTMRSISANAVDLFNVETEDDDGKKRRMFLYADPSGHDFPIARYEEELVASRITAMLKDESPIPISRTLLLDAIHYFNTGRFQEAIIIANIVLDIEVEENIRRNLQNQQLPTVEIEKKIGHILDEGIEKALKRTYFNGLDDETRESDPVWKKFISIRNARTSIIHPHTKRNKNKQLEIKDSRALLTDIVQLIGWIATKKLDFTQ